MSNFLYEAPAADFKRHKDVAELFGRLVAGNDISLFRQVVASNNGLISQKLCEKEGQEALRYCWTIASSKERFVQFGFVESIDRAGSTALYSEILGFNQADRRLWTSTRVVALSATGLLYSSANEGDTFSKLAHRAIQLTNIATGNQNSRNRETGKGRVLS